MTAELKLSRSKRLADAAWQDQILFDGVNVGEIRNGGTFRLSISAGAHTLQVRSLHVINRQLGLASPTVTFEALDAETTEFVCHTREFGQAVSLWFACLRGDRTQWITLEQTGTPAAAPSVLGVAART
jgi:hypothetical protein